MKSTTTILLLLIFAIGCTGPQQATRHYDVSGFTVKMMNPVKLKEAFYSHGGNKNVRGFCNLENRIIYVPYSNQKDINGKPLPDFETLGHEVWHLKELGGRWHK